MYGSDIALKQYVVNSRVQDFLVEAERQRKVESALAGRQPARRNRFAEARASVASVLLRAGSWLMPEEAPDRCSHPATCAFELRPGQ